MKNAFTSLWKLFYLMGGKVVGNKFNETNDVIKGNVVENKSIVEAFLLNA